MRFSIALASFFIVLAGLPALAIAPKPLTPEVTGALKLAQKLAPAQLNAAYPASELSLARSYRRAGLLKEALGAASIAAKKFDALVELHKALSESLLTIEAAQAERSRAIELGTQRDQAFLLTADVARELGEHDQAVRNYVLVVQSEPDTPLGNEAYAALQVMGFAAPLAAPKPQL
jgi:tetratricopeptide (TPR) repeat protein